MTRFTTSRQDPRRLSMLAHQLAAQSPARRRHIHGPIRAAEERHGISTRLGLAVALLAPLPFVLPHILGWLS